MLLRYVLMVFPIQCLEDLIGNIFFMLRFEPYSSDWWFAIICMPTFELYRDTYCQVHTELAIRWAKQVILRATSTANAKDSNTGTRTEGSQAEFETAAVEELLFHHQNIYGELISAVATVFVLLADILFCEIMDLGPSPWLPDGFAENPEAVKPDRYRRLSGIFFFVLVQFLEAIVAIRLNHSRFFHMVYSQDSDDISSDPSAEEAPHDANMGKQSSSPNLNSNCRSSREINTTPPTKSATSTSLAPSKDTSSQKLVYDLDATGSVRTPQEREQPMPVVNTLLTDLVKNDQIISKLLRLEKLHFQDKKPLLIIMVVYAIGVLSWTMVLYAFGDRINK